MPHEVQGDGGWLLVGLILAGTSCLFGSQDAVKPVTPNASPEAVELLKFIHSLSGKHTLTGQHNFPNTKDTYTQRAAQSWGKMPAVYGQDMGFAKEGEPGFVSGPAGHRRRVQAAVRLGLDCHDLLARGAADGG